MRRYIFFKGNMKVRCKENDYRMLFEIRTLSGTLDTTWRIITTFRLSFMLGVSRERPVTSRSLGRVSG